MYPEIKGLDWNIGLSYTNGDKELYNEFLTVYLEDAKIRQKEIPIQMKQNQYNQVTVSVHAVKSASLNIGAVMLSEQAKNLEIAGKQKNITYLLEHIPSFLKEYQTLTDGIEDYLSKQEMATDWKKEGKEKVTKEKIIPYLEKIRLGCEEMDIDPIEEAIKELKTFSYEKQLEETLDKIATAAHLFHYQEIKEYLKEFFIEREGT